MLLAVSFFTPLLACRNNREDLPSWGVRDRLNRPYYLFLIIIRLSFNTEVSVLAIPSARGASIYAGIPQCPYALILCLSPYVSDKAHKGNGFRSPLTLFRRSFPYHYQIAHWRCIKCVRASIGTRCEKHLAPHRSVRGSLYPCRILAD